MNQIRKFFSQLTVRQKLTLAAMTILVAAGIYVFVRWNIDRDFKPLYTELPAEESGAVIAKLRESGVEFKVRDADNAILVPSANVAELRMQMASAGIPKSGRIGYELFDRTNIGTTDFSEQVNYHRAIEGELERSVMSMSEVSEARVHITFPKDSVFSDDRKPAKASVMVKLKTGAHLSEANAAAIAQLVSSAVEGLGPEAVSVMDMKGNLLIRPRKANESGLSDDTLESKNKLEHDIEAKISSVLDPLLGSAKYRTAVMLDCDLTSGEESDETFDPTHSVITNSQKTEEGSTLHAGTAGVPGTQSNLPRPTTARPTSSGNGLARRSETVSYETNRTVRRIRMPQGLIRRMTVSVVVDQDLQWQVVGQGKKAHLQRVLTPPTPERLKAIQSLVAAAAGVNTQRGDVLAVETQPFESTLTSDPPASMVPRSTQSGQPNQKLSPVLLGALAGGGLLLGLGAFLFLRKRKAQMPSIEAQAARDSIASAPQADQRQVEDRTGASLPAPQEVLSLKPITTTKVELLTKHLTEQAEKDPASFARIVRTWLDDSPEA